MMAQSDRERLKLQVLGAGQGIVRADFGISLRTAVQNMVAVSGERAGVIANSLADALRRDRINRSILKATHDRLAAKARSAAISAYKARNPRRKIAPYRTGGSRVGYGLTLAALQDGGHANASTAFRVVPFDTDILDSMTRVGATGALWRQINFGAKPNSGKAPKPYTIAMPGGGGFTLQMPDLAVPAGVLKRPAASFWVNSEGERVPMGPPGDDELRIRKNWRNYGMIPLRGSRATQFMDAALRSLQNEWPKEYTRMYSELLNDARQRARLERGGVRVPQRIGSAAPPRFFKVNVRATRR